MIGLDRELDVLKKSMRRMRTTIDCFQPRSMDITRLVFHPKRGGTVKNLYVPSHILTKYEYFQLCQFCLNIPDHIASRVLDLRDLTSSM